MSNGHLKKLKSIYNSKCIELIYIFYGKNGRYISYF